MSEGAANSGAVIFISHSSRDAADADEIGGRLAGLGLKAWIYRAENEPGMQLVARINEGLATASYFVLLASSNSMGSRWVQWEINAATYLSASEKGLVLVPVCLEQVQLPPLLLCLIKIDLFKDRAKGLDELTNFFRRELRRTAAGGARSALKGTALAQLSLRELRLLALQCLDDQDIAKLLRRFESPAPKGLEDRPRLRLMQDLYDRPEVLQPRVTEYLVHHKLAEAEAFLNEHRRADPLENVTPGSLDGGAAASTSATPGNSAAGSQPG